MSIETVQPDCNRSRFAPSTTGRAHPGTLLAALLCWLDARSRGGEILLRLEDLDPERNKPGFNEAMREDLAWFGLDWDRVTTQRAERRAHDEALTRLVAEGRVYACECSRAEIRRSARRAPDGSYRYPGTCRARVLRAGAEEDRSRPLRMRLDPGESSVVDESGLDLSGDPAELFGDPILRRRDGAYSYLFASTVDDARAGIDRVVRGRDLAPTTILQVGIQAALGYATPAYRHHALLLEVSNSRSPAEGRGAPGSGANQAAEPVKFSKFHGAVDVDALRGRYAADALCGVLASFVGLVAPGNACHPRDLVSDFDWGRVGIEDVPVDWSPERGLTLRR